MQPFKLNFSNFPTKSDYARQSNPISSIRHSVRSKFFKFIKFLDLNKS
jgi:hypothetical protein